RRAAAGTVGLVPSGEALRRERGDRALEARRMAHLLSRCAVLAATLAVASPGAATAKRTPTFPWATTSSPITMSLDGRLVWVVNPKADTVSVIWAGRDRVVGTIKLGDDPPAAAVDPANRHAYVANAATSTVSVVRITD